MGIKKIVSAILLSLLFLFTSCYFFTSAEDSYITVDPNADTSSSNSTSTKKINLSSTSSTFTNKYYLFEDYDSMVEITVLVINKIFTTWHFNKTKFNVRYEKYHSNVDFDTDSKTTIEDNSTEIFYRYCVFIGKGSRTFSSGDDKTITVSGTYFLITDYDEQTSTLFYTN